MSLLNPEFEFLPEGEGRQCEYCRGEINEDPAKVGERCSQKAAVHRGGRAYCIPHAILKNWNRS